MKPMAHRYMVRRPLAIFLLRCIDACLPRSKPPLTIPVPKRILLSNLAHLGDVIIATSVLPVLKHAFPEAKIDFLIGSWSQDVLKNHPLVNHVYVVDHWKHNRSSLPLWKKFWIYWCTGFKTIRKARKTSYDVAIDLYYYFGNSLPLLWFSKIGVRIGYTSGGFGPLLTHPFKRFDQNQHLCLYYLDLLKVLPLKTESLSKLKSTLIPTKPLPFCEKKYIVLHMGVGDEIRAWEEEKWKTLSRLLVEAGYLLIFTGKGWKDKERIQRVRQGICQTMSLCDQLSWEQLLSLIQGTKLLISVNSSPPHIASTFNTPTLVIFCGINQENEWKANHAQCKLLMQKVPCAPCFQAKGCASMACIRKLSAETVYLEAKQMLKNL